VVVPPNIPGATFVGSKACEECHEDLYKEFIRSATHARLMTRGTNAINMGCESCHGPGSLHVESGGERRTATNFRPGDPQVAPGLQRQTIVNPRRSAENCFDCHLDKHAQFTAPYHHPVPEGKMSCGDCHDPHKGPAIKGGSALLTSLNESCLKCHVTQNGPHVFEHEAMREGCTTCHDPHGSINQKMLVARNQNLCLKCHTQQIVGGAVVIGGFPHTGQLRIGTCWTAGCHEAVHGSQVNSSLRY
jgi:predicted CXXCH cytochrome family protein